MLLQLPNESSQFASQISIPDRSINKLTLLDFPPELLFKLCHHLNAEELANLHLILPNVIETYVEKYDLQENTMLYSVPLFKKYLFDFDMLTIATNVLMRDPNWEVLKLMLEMGFRFGYEIEKVKRETYNEVHNCPDAGWSNCACYGKKNDYLDSFWTKELGWVIYQTIKKHPNVEQCLDDLEKIFSNGGFENFGRYFCLNLVEDMSFSDMVNRVRRREGRYELIFLKLLALSSDDTEFADTLHNLIFV